MFPRGLRVSLSVTLVTLLLVPLRLSSLSLAAGQSTDVGSLNDPAVAENSAEVPNIEQMGCSQYETCSDCLGVKDASCGWCILENKCSLVKDCEELPNTPLHWITHHIGKCPTIAAVTPNMVPISTVTDLDLVVKNLPRLTGRFRCAFSTLNETITTNARRDSDGVDCPSPAADLLPSIPPNEHHLATKLSVRRTIGPDLVSTDFSFFDCNTYTSCTECASSRFPCDWCVDKHACTHDTTANCPADLFITTSDKTGPNYRRGTDFCAKISPVDPPEILIPSGVEKPISYKVFLVGEYMALSRFNCQFNIEGRVVTVNAQLLGDTVYCHETEFSSTSELPSITVPVVVNWSRSKALENPEDVHVVIYQCKYMADNCDACAALDVKYDCGWCHSSNTCEVRHQCDTSSHKWLNRNQRCPIPTMALEK